VALKAKDRQLVEATERKNIQDSIDLDEASRVDHPQENRWDYIVSVPRYSRLVGIEPHPARDGEVKVVIAKRKFAMTLLRHHLPPRHRVGRWLWASHGRVGFSRMERVRRLLDQNGIEFIGRLVKSL